MKNNIQFFLLTVLAVLLFSSCSKETNDFPQIPPPGSPDTTSYVMWTVTGVEQTGKQLYALVTIEDGSGQPVVTNKKVTLDDIQGTYKTDKILLPKGTFKLSKFIVVQSSDTAVYAAPKVNTPKGALVTKPLSFDFAIVKNEINTAAVQVLKINNADAPGSFGYSDADFGLQPYTNLNVKLKINVGTVAYDSLPGRLLIDAVNNEGEHWLREIDLQKGITGIRVPEGYAAYKFRVAKWNTVAQKELARLEMQAGMLVALEASRQPKRLVEEAAFIENNTGFVADSRTEYLYGASGLSVIKNYQKSLQVSGLPLANVYNFIYTGSRLDSIKRHDGNNVPTGYTAFEYQFDKIEAISNKSYDQHTGAVVEYITGGDNEVINIDYLFHNGNTMNYKIFMKDGNRIADQAFTSTGGSEGGIYEYDNNINPKYQQGYPDIYFINYSKNNLTREQKSYGGAIPSVVPYKFEYIYDNDGYPAEVYISYKGFTSHDHLYRIKKTFSYQ